MLQIVANLFALIGSLALSFSTRQKTKSQIVPIIIISDVSFILANLCIGTYPAAIINLISLIRNTLAARERLSPKLGLILTLFGIIFALIFNTYGLLVLLPISASTLYALALIFTRSPQILRLSLFFNMSLWSTHDFLVGLYTSSFINFLGVILIFINLLKYSLKPHQKSKKTATKHNLKSHQKLKKNTPKYNLKSHQKLQKTTSKHQKRR